MRIAISGKSRSGKDTTAEYIGMYLKPYGEYKFISFAKPLYDCTQSIQHILAKPVKKDPKLLQFLGEGLREHYGKDIFVNYVKSIIESIPSDISIIITDLRYQNEYEMLKKLGFIMIRIERNNRPIDRDPNHISEIDLDNAEFDFIIHNDQLSNLSKQVNDILHVLRK